MAQEGPYPQGDPQEQSWSDQQPSGGEFAPPEAGADGAQVGDTQTWDTFAGGSLAWSQRQPESNLDLVYLTDQHPQASGVGVTDTEAGAQFFGGEEEGSWHARENHGDMLLGNDGMDRNLAKAVISALGFGGVAAVCFLLGRWATLILLLLLLVLASGELFGALRKVGYQPAVLVGIASVVGLPIAVYWRGAQAYPLAIGLALIATFCWYLFGVTSERPIPNIAATFFGIGYVGVLGSFGVLLLREENGIGLLLGAVVATVAYDSFAWAVGRLLGRTRLSKASPKKTVEGLIGGILGSVLACWLILGMLRIDPWGENPGSIAHVLALGVAAAVAATLGDLCESMIKRDLGVKDMGRLIPGHGGILDRFDGLLFVLPVTWGLALITNVIEAAPS